MPAIVLGSPVTPVTQHHHHPVRSASLPLFRDRKPPSKSQAGRWQTCSWSPDAKATHLPPSPLPPTQGRATVWELLRGWDTLPFCFHSWKRNGEDQSNCVLAHSRRGSGLTERYRGDELRAEGPWKRAWGPERAPQRAAGSSEARPPLAELRSNSDKDEAMPHVALGRHWVLVCPPEAREPART